MLLPLIEYFLRLQVVSKAIIGSRLGIGTHS